MYVRLVCLLVGQSQLNDFELVDKLKNMGLREVSIQSVHKLWALVPLAHELQVSHICDTHKHALNAAVILCDKVGKSHLLREVKKLRILARVWSKSMTAK